MIARIYLGFDPREAEAYVVAENSIIRNASIPVDVRPLRLDKLRRAQLIWRRMEMRDGVLWDLLSKAPCSTEFAISRFAVPLLAHSGWAAFMDPDIICYGDVAELFALADEQYAVMCVKHPELEDSGAKMDGQIQARYFRKNWSSVALYNADHPANARLTLGVLNNTPGRDLHRFGWLNDNEIGALPEGWNWLCGVRERPQPLHIAHLTQGGPFLPGWQGGPYDALWHAERQLIG